MFDKKKLMLVITLFLSAGFLATSFASYFAARSSLREEITRNSLPLTGDNIYSEIQRDLLQPIFICSLMANDTFLKDWVIRGERDKREITRYLNAIKKKYNTITSFFVSDATGNYYYAEGILKQVRPDEERDIWYYRVRGMEQLFEINIDPDLANNDAMTIFINYKVFDYSGNFIGATGVGLTVNAVIRLINEYQEKYSRNIYFIDSNGDIRLRGKNAGPDSASVTNVKEIEGISGLAETIAASPEGTYSYKRDGRTYYLNTRFIEEFDWILLVEESDDKAAKAILRTLFTNIVICLVITLIVLVIIKYTVESYQRRIEKLASTDKLTGALNRLAFDVITDQAIRDSARSGKPLSFIIIDIDRFKTINDTFGHIRGDEILVKTVDIIRSQLRVSDVLCRWGGDEFFIMLKDCSPEDAFVRAENIRKAAKSGKIMAGEAEISLTLSCGVSALISGDSCESVLERADSALFEAKRNGRDMSAVVP